MDRKRFSIALVASIAGLAFGSMGCNDEQALTDGEILAIYNQVNTFDIETAGLGIARGDSVAVRELAQMVKDDHTAVYNAAAQLAQELQVQLVLPSDREAAAREHSDVMARLGALSGPDFDRAYLQHETAFHTDAIGAVRDTLMPAASPRVRDFMAMYLPGFEAHLNKTIQVSKDLGY